MDTPANRGLWQINSYAMHTELSLFSSFFQQQAIKNWKLSPISINDCILKGIVD
jgi:hypothetical protein